MADDTEIRPVAWGIILFLFWGLVQTTPGLKDQILAIIMGWISIVFSAIMFLAIFPCIRKLVNKPQYGKLLRFIVFAISWLTLSITFVETLVGVSGLIQWIASISVLIWLVTIICVWASRIPVKLSLIGCLLLLIQGVVSYLTVPTFNLASVITIVVLAGIMIICSVTKPPWLSELDTI